MPYIGGLQLHQVQHFNPADKSQAIRLLLDPKNNFESVSVQDYAQAEIFPCKTEPLENRSSPKPVCRQIINNFLVNY